MALYALGRGHRALTALVDGLNAVGGHDECGIARTDFGWQVEQLADRIAQPVEQVLELAVRRYFDVIEQEAIHDETEAFWGMYEQLRAQTIGQYVALYRGSVVDHDADVSRLEQRMRERFGPLPVLIAPVEPAPPRELQWRGGRIEPTS